MSSKIFVAILVLVGVGGGVWYAMQTSTVEAPEVVEVQKENEETESPTMEEFAGSGSLRALWTGRDSGYCTFSSTIDGTKSDGKAWFADQKFAIESVSLVEGDLYSMNMINNGERTYMWSGTAAGSMAMVMDNEEMENLGADAPVTDASPESQFDIEQDVDYKCRGWNLEPLKFVPPSNIRFTDYSDIINGTFEGMMRGMPEGMDIEVQTR